MQLEHYSDEKIRTAVQRSKKLMRGKEEKIPSDYGTYIYIIVDEILEVEECGLPVDHSAEEEGSGCF